jgi:hypothetical protein
MSTGRAGALLVAATVMILGGCAGSEPRAILSAGELDAMIRVQVTPVEAARADAAVVAALQP